MGAVSGDDPKQLVRRGYDALSYRYRADDADDGNYGPWLAALRARIPDGAAVLDVGCGNGIPVARHLAAAGHAVTGVDSSQVQIWRARRLVPAATFLHADITSLTLPAATFDAVVCLYALIHLPWRSNRRC
jgi:2-polyprenyl-3-methyl-5-hydroxy-6-metoxy-1,4-benzoquinol methylase